MCTICGDISQIPAEIQASSVAFQSLLALPVVGWIAMQVRNLFRDVQEWWRDTRAEL